MLQGYVANTGFSWDRSGAFGVVLLALGLALGSGQKDAEKLSPYECGFEPFEDSRIKFDVRYYLVAILFIIFDLEIAFLFPWAVSLDVDRCVWNPGDGRISRIVLVIGFIYEWKKGALWNGIRDGYRNHAAAHPWTGGSRRGDIAEARVRRHDHRQSYELGAHGLPVAHDIRFGLLRSRDDARWCGSL